jgi:Arc/MetJ-type ribon-helix-helix transcriptional regulator
MTGPHIASDAVRKQLKKVLDRNGNREKAERVRQNLKTYKNKK